jgi:hypothetical protein
VSDDKLVLEGISAEEQTKALLESNSFSLFARYARTGSNRIVLSWMSDRLRLVMGELHRNIREIDEQADSPATASSPPAQGRIFRVGRK